MALTLCPPGPASGPSSHFPSLPWQHRSEVLLFQPLAHFSSTSHATCLCSPTFPPHQLLRLPDRHCCYLFVSSDRSCSRCRPGRDPNASTRGIMRWILSARLIYTGFSWHQPPWTLTPCLKFSTLDHDEHLWPRTRPGTMPDPQHNWVGCQFPAHLLQKAT